jgi:hypothetical protein
VFIDNVPVGHPTYNQPRSDIATLFPGYANSNGPVGYFYIDTTTLTNGVHTISWLVTDGLGSASGIGSRYFTVSNGSLVLDPTPGSATRGYAMVIASNAFMAPLSAGLSAAASDPAPIASAAASIPRRRCSRTP